MNKIFRRIIKLLLTIVLCILLILGLFIEFAYVTDYRPDALTSLEITNPNSNKPLATQSEYKAITFNTGYGALGFEQDFFMDGGSGGGAHSLEEVETNVKAIEHYLDQSDFDFALLQEVDTSGKRSFDVNQYNRYLDADLTGIFGYNYKVKYVPLPLTHPMGGAKSGIATLSKFTPRESTRHSFNGQEMAIQQLFDLKRAFTITRYPVENGKDFVLINAHFSAFDKGGKIRKQQLEQMQNVLIDEYKKANYVMLGADFNHELPTTDSSNFTWTDTYPDWIMRLPEDFTPQGFNWAVDAKSPSVRGVDKPYSPGNTFMAVIDGFLVSDNIEIISVKGQDHMDFENSDHNPVELSFKLLD